MIITDVIRMLLVSASYRSTSPCQITSGECEDFQQEVIRRAQLDGYYAEKCTENYRWWSDLPGHCWIFHEGRHYDAEVPDGVDHWWNLPIFERQAARKRELRMKRRIPMTDINIKGEIEAFLASLKCQVTEHDGIMVVETPSGTAWDFTIPQLCTGNPPPPARPAPKPVVTPVVNKGKKSHG